MKTPSKYFEAKFGPTPINRIWFGYNLRRNRSDDPLKMMIGITMRQLRKIIKYVDGRTPRIAGRNVDYLQHISGEQAIDDEDKRDGAFPG